MTKRILLVDDEEAVLEALAMTLRRVREVPLEVDTAPTAAAALEKLAAQPYDLVVADYRMPGMNGVDLLARVREGWPSTVRALLTGYNDVEIAVDAMEKAGIHYYVQKPWDNDKLRATVAEAVQREWGPIERNR